MIRTEIWLNKLEKEANDGLTGRGVETSFLVGK